MAYGHRRYKWIVGSNIYGIASLRTETYTHTEQIAYSIRRRRVRSGAMPSHSVFCDWNTGGGVCGQEHTAPAG